jgi:hypothetical protein
VPDNTAKITNLIQGLQTTDPRLYQALGVMVEQVQDLYFQLNPLVAQSQAPTTIVPELDPPTSFTFSFTPTTVRFNWSEVIGASQYEIRLGTVWATAVFVLRSVSLQADIDALSIGTHNYLIKSLNSSGTYSTDSTALVVTVPAIPAVSISSQIIDNNVLLSWNEPLSSFTIDFYEVFKDGVSLGILDGTFFTRFETVSGTYAYSVIATDIAGNESATASVTLIVASPPDFQLQDSRVSDFDGTKDSTIIYAA